MKPHEIQGFTKNVQLEAPWTEIVIHHMKTALYLDAGEYEEAFLSQKEVVQSLQRFMPNMTRWVLPVLYLFNNDLRLIATRADQDKEAAEGQRRKLEEAANVISKSFTYCITDRGPMMTSKKYGTYRMIGMLFRIYFKLKQQNLCKNILRAVKAADMPSLEQFPKSDRVTFRYYLGRLYFLEEDYVKAENELNLAFKECTKHHLKNKELILQTLLPVKLMKGMLPTKTLLSMFPQSRQIYSQLAIAVKKGDVKSFNIALTNSESTLIKQRTYFAVEKAESIALRQLFRKVFLVMGQNTRLPIAKFQQALNFEGMTIDIEEAEWMLANMIYKGYMKGYLSHEKMYLVLTSQYDLSTFGFFQRNTMLEVMNFSAITVTERTELGQRQSVEVENNVIHIYMNSQGLSGIIISDKDYPSRVAFSLLNKVVDEVLTKYSHWNTADTIEYPELAQYIHKYQDPQQADNIMKVQKELDETTTIMHKTIESLLQRGEKIH
ncbi:hypothetical protein G6F16_005150 [Rhizopus arrhizus]|uniref:PCI domain-containing protein n=1 Tax=Rhizopus oryzae TaxID=64495 RepID=A0A9P7BPX7_RHIOR|nr:hypothetical protein G6F23_008270 [Rhizopus arrhizus]KAG0758878.1 hypothetical protein G6F24_009482 [Rhizopus arrhizus]KAG0783741.1 hypothetical protein G6F21_010352 [Rhizopus arrhizus]KAG0796997.1 hypothetical protein G6F22_004793 [Rhizopus arrhizus]KAG0807944.1 hypothetical protein G6F20_009973 [Rhizopus arrhizus]